MRFLFWRKPKPCKCLDVLAKVSIEQKAELNNIRSLGIDDCRTVEHKLYCLQLAKVEGMRIAMKALEAKCPKK